MQFFILILSHVCDFSWIDNLLPLVCGFGWVVDVDLKNDMLS